MAYNIQTPSGSGGIPPMSPTGPANGFLQQPYPRASSSSHAPPVQPTQPTETEYASPMDGNSNFDIFDWHPAYQSCQRFFLDHAQHESSTQAVAALINICLPFQWSSNPVHGSSQYQAPTTGPGGYPLHYPPRQTSGPGVNRPGAQTWVSLVPYIRRLVVTGFDKDGVLHGFFGNDWRKGIGPLQECERRNYLFAAKSVGWAKVKYQYDMSPHETVPFIKPLENVQLAEIEGAEKTWSQWLAMEDWMVGPRAPDMDDLTTRDERLERARE